MIVLVGASSVAAASEEDLAYDRTGFYVLLGAAIGFENSEDLDDSNELLDDLLDLLIDAAVDNGDLPPGTTGSGKLDIPVMPGVAVAAGYRLNSRVAIEGEFEWAKADVDFDIKLEAPGFEDFTDSSKVGEYSYWLLSANAKLFILTGLIQPFALVGVGVTTQEVDFDGASKEKDTGVGFRFGGGADIYVTQNAAITADFTYVLTEGDVEDNDLMSLNVGVLWRF